MMSRDYEGNEIEVGSKIRGKSMRHGVFRGIAEDVGMSMSWVLFTECNHPESNKLEGKHNWVFNCSFVVEDNKLIN